MKFYNAIQQVYLPRESVIKARDFAEKVTATTNYGDSMQLISTKIKDDHFISKLGEEAAKLVFCKFAVVHGPDYTIYPAAKKSWSNDLIINNTGLSIKTQRRSAAVKYSLSWTFQCGSTRKDIILNKPEAWVVFVEYNDHNPYCCLVYPPVQIKELTFGEPKLDYLKPHKKVVYASTLKIG